MAGQAFFISLAVSAFVLVLTFRRVASIEEYTLGVLLPYTYDADPEYPTAKRYASAVTLAVDKVNSDPTLLNGARLSFVWNNTACNQSKMVQQQHWQIKQGVVGFIGPSCHGRKAARVAGKHGLAVVSYDCQDSHVSNKKLYPNFARTNPQDSKAAFKILELLKQKGWERVNIVYEDRRKWISFKKFFSRQLKRSGVEIINRIKIQPHAFTFGGMEPKILPSVNSRAQATIFVTPFEVTREIMYNLQTFFEKNPSSSYSKHGFVAVPMNRLTINLNYRTPFKWFYSFYAKRSAEETERTQRAFKKLLVVSNVPDKETEQFKLFEEELKEKSSQKPWYSDAYTGCLRSHVDNKCFFYFSSSKIPLKGVYLYDAVIQFANALHEVRKRGEKPTGKNIVNKLKGKQFTGADGYEHEFDENADVIYEYTVLGLKKDKNNKLNMLPVESQNRIFHN